MKIKLYNYKLFLFGSTFIIAILLVFFLPKQSKYHFIANQETGRPWLKEAVIAPYDFPIYKHPEVIKREQDSVLSSFQPYFQYEEKTSQKELVRFLQAIQKKHYKKNDKQYLFQLHQKLKEVYKHGIVQEDEYDLIENQGCNSIRIINKQEAFAAPLKIIFTPKTAYQFILQQTEKNVNLKHNILSEINLSQYIIPNLQYDDKKSSQLKKDLLSSVSELSGMMFNGQKIIDKGEIVSEQTNNILLSLQKEEENRTKSSAEIWLIHFGQFLFITLCLSLLTSFLYFFRRKNYTKPNQILLPLFFVCFFPLCTYLMISYNWFSVYIFPFVMCLIFLRIFLDSRTALITYLLTIILASLSLHEPYHFITYEIIIGLVTIYSLHELTIRSQLFNTAIIITLVGYIFGISTDLLQGLSISMIDTRWLIHITLQGVFLLFTYPMLLIVEKTFGFTSSVTLVELSNTNHPLLLRLSKEAQGTFNHSMQVANLATEVAKAIGAKVQLVRTGALYHDIGKLINPAFFTENQTGVNPHSKISEVESAAIIIGHVTEGIRLAEKFNLPKELHHFITTHHGRGKVKYFYIQYCNKHPEEKVDEELFTYPGPNPFTKEQAILMMCDSVEATSRSLKTYDEESITQLVNEIIDSQVQEGFFNACPITFLEIKQAKEVLIESLKTIYHTRITYPKLHTQTPLNKKTIPFLFTLKKNN